jgi:ABC-type Fe3+/spermidine/putrescine transport system ATPase subunit
MVFQNYALFPNLTVAGNIAFGLSVAGEKRQTIHARVFELLELIHLPDYGGRYPYQLSGGQQQRVARRSAPSSSNWGSPPCTSPTTRMKRSRCQTASW